VLGLIASGRMRPDTGTVRIDGSSDNRMLRRRVALVDAPDVNDPHPDVAVAGVVGEELMFAGRGATPLHARSWLKHTGYPELAGVPFSTVPTAARVRILCELAVLREGVEGLVLVHPDRHGGRPESWWPVVQEFAERGLAMLVIVGGAAAAAIERMPELEPAEPVEPVEPAEPVEEEAASTPSTPPLAAGAPAQPQESEGAPTTDGGLDESEEETSESESEEEE
jgi:hypothetical protein